MSKTRSKEAGARQILNDSLAILQKEPSLPLVGAMMKRTSQFVERVGSRNYSERYLDTLCHVEACIMIGRHIGGVPIAQWDETPGRTYEERVALLKKAARKT